MKKCLSYLIECLLVSKHTNQVLKEVARCIAALLFVLFFSIDWDATLDAWGVLATWQPETQADIDWLVDDCDSFNAGADLDWLEHCPTCQEVALDVQEVQE